MIAEFPIYLGVKLSYAQHAAVQSLAAAERTTVSAIVRKLIADAANRDLVPDEGKTDGPHAA